MPTTEPLSFGSLFTGIGGIDLGFERAGMRALWQCENDPYHADKVLPRHWPHLPNLGDVTQVDWSTVERPDVLAGGFMCTDLSNAGARAGMEGDTRSGTTWREYERSIRELRPRYVVIENVTALLTGRRGEWFSIVLGALHACGYDAEWDCLPASAFGAAHERDRVWLVAYPAGVGREESRIFGPLPGDTATRGTWQTTDALDAIRRGAVPALCRGAHGLRHRVDRMRGLGNAVCPVVAEFVGGLIINHFAVHV